MMKNLGIESAKTEQERLRDVMKIEPRNVTELTERQMQKILVFLIGGKS